MKLKQFLKENEDVIKTPISLEAKVHSKIKDLFSVIEHYENSGEIKKDDVEKIDTFKKYIQHFIEEEEKKSV